jgi:CRP-like cAMP-binding protein
MITPVHIKPKRLHQLTMALLVLSTAHALAPLKPAFFTAGRTPNSHLRMLPKRSELFEKQEQGNRIGLSLVLGSLAPLAGLVSTAEAAGLPDPLVEAQVLNDISHLGLDLAAFLGPGMLYVRLAAIAGRLCTMAADYLPDHLILPEEFAFQLFMLAMGAVGLAKAAMLPTFAATASKVTLRDGKAYLSLFAPAGMSWTQYKALSVVALDWVTLKEGEHASDDGSSMYWLFSGHVNVSTSSGAVLHVSRVHKQTHAAGCALLGERRFMRRLETRTAASLTASSPSPSTMTIQAMSNSTTMLRIDTVALLMFMESDPKLADTIRTLLFQSMEAKLDSAQLPPPSLPLLTALTLNVTA